MRCTSVCCFHVGHIANNISNDLIRQRRRRDNEHWYNFLRLIDVVTQKFILVQPVGLFRATSHLQTIESILLKNVDQRTSISVEVTAISD